MDNISRLVPGTDPRRVVILTPDQYALYQSNRIEIYSPDGEHLESIGHQIQKEAIEVSNYQVKDQVALLECLLGKINDDLDLPARAVSGLSDVFYRMYDFCERHST